MVKRVIYIILAALMASLAISCKKDNEKKSDEELNFSMRISLAEIELSVGAKFQEKVQLYVSFDPEDVRLDVEWSSDEPNIARVSETGEVTASSPGNAVITARCGDKEVHCNVTVIVPVEIFGFVSSLQSKSLAVGQVFNWSVVYMPTYATDHNVVFENSDPSVADFKQDDSNPCSFTVTAKELGTTTITARCGGKEAELFIFVDAVNATKVTVTPATLNLECGESQHLTATVEPSNATNPVSWTSLSPEIVEVSYGSVRGLRPGTGTVVACCGDQTAQCYVTVSGLPEGAVDLGLSVYWAECNLGASSPFDAGDYYAWGEIAPKSNYDWENYKFYAGGTWRIWDYYRFSRYNGEDGKIAFSSYDYADDAARKTLGGQWRVPTLQQFNELINNCEIVFEGDGVRFYSTVPGYVGQSLYFPLEGYKEDNRLVKETTSWHDSMALPYATSYIGYYWLSEIVFDNAYPYSLGVECKLWLNPGADPFEWRYWDDGQHDLWEVPEARPSALLHGEYRRYGNNIRPVW